MPCLLNDSSAWKAIVADKALEMVGELDDITGAIKMSVIEWIEKSKLWAVNYSSLQEMLDMKMIGASKTTIADYAAVKKVIPLLEKNGIATPEEVEEVNLSNMRMVAPTLVRLLDIPDPDIDTATEIMANAAGMTWYQLKTAMYTRKVPVIEAVLGVEDGMTRVSALVTDEQLEMLKRNMREDMRYSHEQRGEDPF